MNKIDSKKNPTPPPQTNPIAVLVDTRSRLPCPYNTIQSRILLQDLNSSLTTLLKNTKHQVTSINFKSTAFSWKSNSDLHVFHNIVINLTQ